MDQDQLNEQPRSKGWPPPPRPPWLDALADWSNETTGHVLRTPQGLVERGWRDLQYEVLKIDWLTLSLSPLFFVFGWMIYDLIGAPR